MDFYSRYKQQALKQYPSTKACFEDLNWRNAVSEEVVSLPSEVLSQIQKTVSSLVSLKTSDSYRILLEKGAPFSLKHSQESLLMAYDFHVSEDEGIKLIEVNTNASGFLVSALISQVHGLDSETPLSALQNSFKKEWEKFRGTSPPKKVLIIDEKPLEQKMLIEFLMYKDFLNSLGWPTEIYDSQDLKLDSKQRLVDLHQNVVDFIYNRTVDFYFKKHVYLAQAYSSQTCCISPHPSDYYLFADKIRLCDWFEHVDSLFSSQEQKSLLKQVLLPTWILTSENQEKAWNGKKNYFFKPLQSYGGRQAYRGKGLTRPRFQKIIKEAFLFQNYCKPGAFIDKKGQEWKFDLRVFVYADEIQHIAARLYQGQVTNFQNLGGGFASVRFSPPLLKLND